MLMDFTPKAGCDYRYDYEAIFGDIANKVLPEVATYKALIQGDLWFFLYFVMRVGTANHPFVVKACRDVDDGPRSKTLDLWAREHYKSTIITTAEVARKVLMNPEERVGIFSHTRPIAKGFLRSIKSLFENSELLKACYPDVLYENPSAESPKWSEDDGLILKRNSFCKESTIEAWGLLEGMPTSKHFTHRVYDDVETADVVVNPDTVNKLIYMFDLSQNLGAVDGTERIVGTTYSHAGLLTYIKAKKNIHGKEVYLTRTKPATDDGTPSGKSVLLSEDHLDILKASEYSFNCQQLLNPTPVGVRKFDSTLIRPIEARLIPKSIYKFMVIDPAGDDKDGKGDAWAIELWGVEPRADDIGASNVYLLDALISPLRTTEAIEEIVRMYIKGGLVQRVGVEKVGLSTFETHIASALAQKGRHISIENGTLQLLKPAGRDKKQRIEAALAWPLYNSKIFFSSDVPNAYTDRLKVEMDKFPYWHDDGLDAASYLYDMLKDYRFMQIPQEAPQYEPVNELVGY